MKQNVRAFSCEHVVLRLSVRTPRTLSLSFLSDVALENALEKRVEASLPIEKKECEPVDNRCWRQGRQDDKIVKSDICPQCGCEHIYQDGGLWVCPECALEWSIAEGMPAQADDSVIRDANGNPLADGDTVTIIKDLKIKGSSSVIKGGTKIKGVRLTDGHDGHNLSCKVPGIGAMNLKSEFVRKA